MRRQIDFVQISHQPVQEVDALRLLDAHGAVAVADVDRDDDSLPPILPYKGEIGVHARRFGIRSVREGR